MGDGYFDTIRISVVKSKRGSRKQWDGSLHQNGSLDHQILRKKTRTIVLTEAGLVGITTAEITRNHSGMECGT
jgi:hypothetical protein